MGLLRPMQEMLLWVIMWVLLSMAFQVAGLSIFVVGSALLAVMDLRTQLIPSRWVYRCLWMTGMALACAAAADAAWHRLTEALVSAVVAVGAFMALHQFSRVGKGDVRLVGLLALSLGWFSPGTALVGLLLGFLVGGLVGAVMLASHRAHRRTMLPFGPCLVAGCWVALLPTICRAV